MARPKAIIDWNKVDMYLKAGCSGAGIAELIGINSETLYRSCRREHKMDFTEYSQKKREVGNDMLRAKQFDTAMKGNVTMQIWLGKQRLDQRERSENEVNINPFLQLMQEASKEEQE